MTKKVESIAASIEHRNSVLTRIDEDTRGYTVKQTNGSLVWIDKKHGVVPKVGDTITIYGQPYHWILGLAINGNILFLKTEAEKKLEIEAENRKEHKKRMQDYKVLMKKIKNETPFKTVNISGFGGGYEYNCQLMLRAGMKYLKVKKDFDWSGYETTRGIYGICQAKGNDAKKLDDVLLKASNDCTGAMHQCVVSHLRYIHKSGYEKWLKDCKGRTYIYPKELPKPTL